MNARRSNNYFRGGNRPRGRRYYNKNNNNRINNNRESNELVVRNIPKRVINDIIKNNPTYKYRRSKNNWKQNNNIKKLNKKLNTLSKGVVNFSIPTTHFDNMINNKNKSKKEPRRDKLITPMNMVLSGKFLPITRISERCLINYTYTKIKINVPYNGYDKTCLILFPYSINFKPDLFNQIDEKVLTLENSMSNIYYNVLQGNIGTNHSYDAYATTATGIIGNWKLIGTSYKLYNTTSRLSIGGNISVTKLTDNIMNPIFTSTARNVGGDLGEIIRPYIERNYDLVQPKNSFGAADIVRIDEFNTSPGTNIFQGPTEYIGCKYTSDLQAAYPKFSNDTVGNNVKYLVEIYSSNSTQSYILEIWNVFAIIPAPSSGLSNVVKLYTESFNPEVVNEMRNRIPMYSRKRI